MSENRYQNKVFIGAGKSGVVYEVLDTKLQRQVAMRRFFDEDNIGDITKHKEEFKVAAQPLVELQHSNLLNVFDVGIDDEGAYVVSQLLSGIGLHELVAKGAMAPYEVANFAKQMLDAFSFIHDKGHYHGALTPGSIMMTPRAGGRYRAILLDMGLAKLAKLIKGESADLSVEMDDVMIAPELVAGAVPDGRSDLYMLGQLFYMCLAGGHPYAGKAVKEVKKLREDGLPSIRQYNSDVPEEFADWLSVLTKVDPAERPESAVDALNALPKVQPSNEAMSARVKQYADKTAQKPTVTTVASTNTMKVNSGKSPVLLTQGSSQPVASPKVVSLPKKKSSAGLFMFLGSLVAIAAVIGVLMVMGNDEGEDEDERDVAFVSDTATSRNSDADKVEQVTDVDSSTVPEVIAYFDGNASKHPGWVKNATHRQSLVPASGGWLLDDVGEDYFTSLKYPIDKKLDKMFARGWRITYRVKSNTGPHQLGFCVSEDSNPGWGEGRVGFSLVIKSNSKIMIFQPYRGNNYDDHNKRHPIHFPSGKKSWVDVVIEQQAQSASGEYVVKINGKKVFKDVLLKNPKYENPPYWDDHLFSSTLERVSKGSWIVGKINLETL